MGRQISLLFLFALVMISLVSASNFGYDADQTDTIDTSTTTNYFNGSNVNLTTTTCSGTEKVISINNATGAVTCGADQGTINTTEQLQDAVGTGFTGNLSYSDSDNLFDINWTNLYSWLQNFFYTETEVDSINDSVNNYIAENNESVNDYILFVNSTNTGGGGSGDITGVNTSLDYFLYNGSDSGDVYLRFNETRLNLSTYALLSVLNNGTYANYVWNSTNTSYVTFPVLNNGSYFNGNSVTWGDLGNGTVAFSSTLNNGTYTNTDTFVGNYSAFLIVQSLTTNNTFAQLTGATFTGLVNTTNDVFARNNLNLTRSYYLATNGTFASTSYVDTQNTSQTNYINTKREITNLTFTNGNANFTTGNVSISSGKYTCYNEACSSYIYFNGTGLIIQG